MRKTLSTLLLITLAFVSTAQTIRYDTIRVSRDDERNIHNVTKTSNVSKQTTPIKASVNNKNTHSAFNIDMSKVRYGASIGLSLTRNYTYVNFGPQIGYQSSNQLLIGAGVKYNYNKIRGYQYDSSHLYKNHLLGLNAFAYFYPIRFITLFAQPEINYLWSQYTNESDGVTSKSSGSVPSLLVGGGLRVGHSHITLNYDLVGHVNSPYSKGVFLGVSVFF